MNIRFENLNNNIPLSDLLSKYIGKFVSADGIVRKTDEIRPRIETGTFDNIADCGYAVPSYWDIGKVYKRLIKMVAEDKKTDVIDALFEVYNSFISPAIDDYNSSFYYENPLFIFECYKAKKIL